VHSALTESLCNRRGQAEAGVQRPEMLRGGRPSDCTPLSWTCAGHQACLLLFTSPTFLSQKYLPLARSSHVSRHRATVRPPYSVFAAAAIFPHAPHPMLFASRSCSSRMPTSASQSLLPQSHPPCAHPRRAASAGARGAVMSLRSVLG
jgi:hypothetical protein